MYKKCIRCLLFMRHEGSRHALVSSFLFWSCFSGLRSPYVLFLLFQVVVSSVNHWRSGVCENVSIQKRLICFHVAFKSAAKVTRVFLRTSGACELGETIWRMYPHQYIMFYDSIYICPLLSNTFGFPRRSRFLVCLFTYILTPELQPFPVSLFEQTAVGYGTYSRFQTGLRICLCFGIWTSVTFQFFFPIIHAEQLPPYDISEPTIVMQLISLS